MGVAGMLAAGLDDTMHQVCYTTAAGPDDTMDAPCIRYANDDDNCFRIIGVIGADD